MVMEDDDLYQKAVLWPSSGYDAYGETKVDISEKVEISVRWQLAKSKVPGDGTHDLASDITIVVDRDVPIGSILWEGELEDLPDTLTNLYRVVDFAKVPDVMGRSYRRVCKLIRHSDTLPETT